MLGLNQGGHAKQLLYHWATQPFNRTPNASYAMFTEIFRVKFHTCWKTTLFPAHKQILGWPIIHACLTLEGCIKWSLVCVKKPTHVKCYRQKFPVLFSGVGSHIQLPVIKDGANWVKFPLMLTGTTLNSQELIWTSSLISFLLLPN